MFDPLISEDNSDEKHVYRLANCTISSLTDGNLLRHSSGSLSVSIGSADIQPLSIAVNQGAFTQASRLNQFPTVLVKQQDQTVWTACDCGVQVDSLCDHQAQVLWSIINRKELRIFFDEAMRHEAIRQVAKDYGLENEPNLDAFFHLTYENRSFTIQPIRKELLPITPAATAQLIDQLLPNAAAQSLKLVSQTGVTQRIIVFSKHRYYDNFCIQLAEAPTTRDGKVKNPLVILNPLDLVHKSDNIDEVKFFTGIAKFQNHHRTKQTEADIEGLKLAVKNPLQLKVFYHNARASETITANSLVPVQMPRTDIELRLSVYQADTLYQVSAKLFIDDKPHDLEKFSIKYDYFLAVDDSLLLVTDAIICGPFSSSRRRTIIYLFIRPSTKSFAKRSWTSWKTDSLFITRI